MSTFDVAAILFVFAAAVGIANDRLFGMPRGIALLLGALLCSLVFVAVGRFTGHAGMIALSEHRLQDANLPKVLLEGVLGLLLFAASLHVDLHALRRHAVAVLGLATIGVIIATAVFGAGLWAVFRMSGLDVSLGLCMLLGAIVAPTDAVAVESLLRRVPLPQSLRDIVSGESLFNDGTAVVLYLAALSILAGEHGVLGHGRLLLSILVEGAGGAILGIAAGIVARLAVGEGKETNVAVIVSIALALGSYRLAAAAGVSGPIAVVAAGLTMAHWRRDSSGRDAWRARMRLFWSLVDDVVNTLLFLLMGMQILDMRLAAFLMPAVLAAIPLALVARLVSVALPVAVLPLGLKDRPRAVAALTWLGLRGAVSVALVLSIPASPHRDALTAACYAVVLFTIVVQGLLTPAVIGRLYRSDGGR